VRCLITINEPVLSLVLAVNMVADSQSPAPDAPTVSARGRGRGGRGGRGRGRGAGSRGGANTSVMPKTANGGPGTRGGGRGGSRRGRAKHFLDSRVQAAYERQRDLKATYQAVAHALKPALQELAERTTDELLQQSDAYKQANEHLPVIEELQRKLDKRIAECDRRRELDLNLAEGIYIAETYVTEREFQVRLYSRLSSYLLYIHKTSLCNY
jgi:hypothetical protein